MFKRILLSTLMLSVIVACGEKSQPTTGVTKVIDAEEIFQAGTNKEAAWAYVGFVPRVSRPENMEIIGSKRGFTLRVHAKFSFEEISHYASYITKRAQELEATRQGQTEILFEGSTQKTPFTVLEKTAYQNFQNEVETNFKDIRDGDFEDNLLLLKKYFPDNVFVDYDNKIVNLQLVYAITTGKNELENYKWLQVDPRKGDYHIQTFEERRAYYSKEPSAFVFGGFPAFWFSGNIGIHGPIRYSTVKSLLDGDYSEKGNDGKISSKRWQLVRKPDSHNCFRMENHMEIRHLMPRYFTKNQSQPELSKINIHILETYDQVDLNHDGKLETIGVKYYWDNPNTAPSEAAWKAKYYFDGIPNNLVEFEYRDPFVVQIKARNLDAAMTHLNRLPRN